MTDDSRPPTYGPPPGHGPAPYGQPPWQPPQEPPQYGRQPVPPQGPPPYGGPGQFGPPSQYGQYGQQTQFPPRIDSKAIKPSLWWIAAAWGVFLACAAAGIVLFANGMGAASDLVPKQTFASGEKITVTVDPADKPGVYLASDTQVTYDCSISGDAKLAKTPDRRMIEAGDAVWEQFLVINAPAKGDYELTCVNEEKATVRYGVGRDSYSVATGLADGMITIIAVSGAGLLAAVAGTIVVLVRRSGARKRLAVSG
jgi:hypothetical protein